MHSSAARHTAHTPDEQVATIIAHELSRRELIAPDHFSPLLQDLATGVLTEEDWIQIAEASCAWNPPVKAATDDSLTP